MIEAKQHMYFSMQADSSEALQQQVLTELKQINQRLDRLETDVEKLDYKFDTYQKASDQTVRPATTIIIASASVVVLSTLLQAFAPAVSAFVSGISAGSS